MHGSFTAKKCVELLTEWLHKSNIDIIAIITDGPNIMLKLRKEIEVDQQLCLAQGIHLAICDALYYNKQNSTQPQTSSSKTIVESCYESENLDLDDDDDEDLETSESLQSGLVLFSENNQDFVYSDVNINELVKRKNGK